MDALVVGGLTAAATVAGMLFWLLLARPEALLGVFSEQPSGEWFDDHPSTLGFLQTTFGIIVVILGFVTGLTVAFLAGTA